MNALACLALSASNSYRLLRPSRCTTMRNAEEDDLPVCHETTLFMWYDDVLPLSKTALAALFAVGMICAPSCQSRRNLTSHEESACECDVMCRLGGIIYDTHVDIWPVDRERAFVLSDHHRHLSVYGVFLQQTKKSVDRKKKKREKRGC